MKTRSVDFSTIDARDALDLAVLVEEEAQDRYVEFADQMLLHHNLEAERFFRFMAVNEGKHHQKLAAQRVARFGDSTPRVQRDMLFDIEAPEYDEVRMFTTPRQALETALRAEVKAHQFFVDALAQVKDPEARVLFEELRDEELEHQRLVEQHMARLPLDSAVGTAEDYADDSVSQ